MNDRFTVRSVVVFLGIIATTVVLGGIWLAAHDKSLTDALIAMGSGALGGLTGFLISSRSATPDQPMPTVEAPVTVTPGDG